MEEICYFAAETAKIVTVTVTIILFPPFLCIVTVLSEGIPASFKFFFS